MRISDWSSDVCSSDLANEAFSRVSGYAVSQVLDQLPNMLTVDEQQEAHLRYVLKQLQQHSTWEGEVWRSEEHTSELQSLMRISYAVFCLKKKHINTTDILYLYSYTYTYQV